MNNETDSEFYFAEQNRLIAEAMHNDNDVPPLFQILRNVCLDDSDPSQSRVTFWLREFDLGSNGTPLLSSDGATEEAAQKLADVFGNPEIANDKRIIQGYEDFQIGTLREARIIRDLLTKLIESNGEAFDYVMEHGDSNDE